MSDRQAKWVVRIISLAMALIVAIGIPAASRAEPSLPGKFFKLPRVTAEQRLFLPLALDFLGEYQLPKQEFDSTTVGGLSAIAYDRQRDRLYALSDDRSDLAPARFYTLKLEIDKTEPTQPKLNQVKLEGVTLLKDTAGQLFAKGTIDPEGLALSPARSLFISSEGVTRTNVIPFIQEFDLQTGQAKRSLPLPERYLPADAADQEPRGVRDNLGFESLTINPGSYGSVGLEPYRVFAVTESALAQDQDSNASEIPCRMLHYMVEATRSLLVSEHLYPLAPLPDGATYHGLTEILAIDQGGHFLSLERSFGDRGFTIRLFQMATGGASDISSQASLKGRLGGVVPIRKQLLLDLQDLGIRLDNLEGMTLGPRLSDGSQSLLLVSDDNFRAEQATQFLLFRLRGLS